jgi:ubiquinone/menaquinone biosynthesis C-methylase UbiE
MSDGREDEASRYDCVAEGYARYWAPVIRPAAERLLEGADAAVAAGARWVLDIGTGTGTLALAAIERWPAVEVSAIDASAGMLDLADRHALERLTASDRPRLRTAVALADELPFEDASFDLALSSFVLQLVPSRAAALREARRVLRTGATFTWVAWLAADMPYAADTVANQVLDEAGFDPPESDPRSGDLASVSAAAAAMRRAGFREVQSTAAMVEHRWDPAGYVSFFTEFDEDALFDELEPAERADIVGRILTRLSALTPEEMTLRLPIVYVSGRAT